MQKFYAWLRPRHYSIDSGNTRRLNGHGLLTMANTICAIGLVFVAVHRLVPTRLTPVDHSAQAVVITSAPVQPTLPETPKPQPLKPVSNYDEVAEAVQQWVNAHSSAQWGVVLQDLNDSDNNVQVNADKQLGSASLYKLFLTIPLAQKLPFSSWATQHTYNGKGRSYADCVKAMLAVSDNPCGEAIGSYLGWTKATRDIHNIGFNGTALNSNPTKTTAADTAKYLVGLDQGEWFDAQTRDFILSSLAAQKYRAGIPAGCSGCTALNKTGQLSGVTNDAAIVTSGKKRFVLVIISKGGSFAQIADLTKLINTTLL